MFHDFRFGLEVVTTHTNALNVFSTMKNSITKVALNNAYSIMQLFCVKKTFKAMVFQLCGNYSKTKSEVIKHYQKYHIAFFIPKHC